ncbi:uncharacterized protein [Dermacentor albipictus]|uniref:uncharacterized protein n=1 Tax=Dermacentor albipictus TaxID=60249 RepID=UPI0038FD0074
MLATASRVTQATGGTQWPPCQTAPPATAPGRGRNERNACLGPIHVTSVAGVRGGGRSGSQRWDSGAPRARVQRGKDAALRHFRDTSTVYLPARQGSGSRATGNDNGVFYDRSSGSSRGSTWKSQKMVPKFSSNPHVAASQQTKLETIMRRPLSSPNLNLSVARRAQDGLRGANRHSQKSQGLVAVAGVPYYPLAVGFHRVYTIPYPWAYYAVYPSWRPPATPATPATPVVNVPVVVHVHPHVVPVQVTTFVSNTDGGVGFALGDGSGVAGSNNPTNDDGIDAGFVPTYGCGTAKAANCRS